jgi:hypothetical protein
MKKFVTAAAGALLAGLIAAPAMAAGNGAPSGSHYSLNIIGVRDKTNMPNSDAGHVIFVDLSGRTDIMLCNSDDPAGSCSGVGFKVLDKNGTDGKAAFALPNPDQENDGVTSYSVFARALGKPYGSAVMTTCAIDPTTLEEVCSTTTAITLTRTKGASKFQNVSKALLYIYADLDGDGNLERYNLFHDSLQDYFWKYDNNGLRIAQLRFYPCSTDVVNNSTTCITD